MKTGKATEFVIVADYHVCDPTTYEECLVCCAGDTQEEAERRLQEVIEEANNGDKTMLKNGINPRIKEVISEEQWWNISTE